MFESGKNLYRKISSFGRGRTLREFLDALPLPGRAGNPDTVFSAIISLIKTVLGGDAGMEPGDVGFVRQQFSEYYTPDELSLIMTHLHQAETITPEQAVEALGDLSADKKERLVYILLALDRERREGRNRDGYIFPLADKLGVSREKCSNMLTDIDLRIKQRKLILKSGAGILVALGVLAVFILTATVLKSVIFGLILAYMMLPLEQYFERRLNSGNGVFRKCFNFMAIIISPLRTLSEKLTRRGRVPDEEELESARRKMLSARAISLTCGTLFLVFLLAVLLLFSLSKTYVKKSIAPIVSEQKTVEHSVVNRVEKELDRAKAFEVAEVGKTNAAEQGRADENAALTTPESSVMNGWRNIIDRFRDYLETHRDDVESNPVIRFAVKQIGEIINNPEAQKELMFILFRRSGGMLTFAADMIGMAISFVVNLLLTIFFFLLFLSKLAAYCSENKSASRPSEYLVNTVFSGTWMPKTSEGVVAEAQRIIGEIIEKLKIWLRGYLSLIGIDLLVYTTAYYLIGVPFFYILGPITACCVILPIIGPLSAVLLTMLVTLAAGGAHATMLQLLAVFAVYLIQNTVIEQFILYPLIFGESLGLTLLETIIVVMLGGIFAGIAGMIFALPTAAILKYLIPQIYHCLEMKNDRN